MFSLKVGRYVLTLVYPGTGTQVPPSNENPAPYPDPGSPLGINIYTCASIHHSIENWKERNPHWSIKKQAAGS